VALVAGGAGDGGVPHGAALAAFAEAALRGDDLALAAARAALLAAAGPEALVDAAAVIANFEMMDRIADATGIPLDGIVSASSGGLRSALGLERFASAANTPRAGLARRLLGRVLEPLAPWALRRRSRRAP
jgi:hypothetical protein